MVTDEGNGICELKNIAVAPELQRRGYGKKLIEYLIAYYAEKYHQMIVGTGDVPRVVRFYQSCGFEYSHRIENFFTDNYDYQMIEDGIVLKDMVYLKRGLFSIRQATPNDIASILDLYRNTVLTVNRRDYSQAEVEDWASCGDTPKSEEMIKTHYFIIAETFQSQIVGFSSITPQGYLHSMFVHKDFQGKGVASTLLNEIERYAKENGITKITSEVTRWRN